MKKQMKSRAREIVDGKEEQLKEGAAAEKRRHSTILHLVIADVADFVSQKQVHLSHSRSYRYR
jgi:hypothetical protein